MTPKSSGASLVGRPLILPTRELHSQIKEELGPLSDTMKAADIDIKVLIEYLLSLWISVEIDQSVPQMQEVSVEYYVTNLAVMDFVLENNLIQQKSLDKRAIEHAVRRVCYLIFVDLIPIIESLNLPESALMDLRVVRWTGMDLIVKTTKRN